MSHQSILEIVWSVCRAFNVKIKDLEGPSRCREIVWPRHVAMKVLHDELNLSLPQLGNLFNREHTTVLYALRSADKDIATDKKLAAQYGSILNCCQRKIRHE